jgi:hypothetical protein
VCVDREREAWDARRVRSDSRSRYGDLSPCCGSCPSTEERSSDCDRDDHHREGDQPRASPHGFLKARHHVSSRFVMWCWFRESFQPTSVAGESAVALGIPLTAANVPLFRALSKIDSGSGRARPSQPLQPPTAEVMAMGRPRVSPRSSNNADRSLPLSRNGALSAPGSPATRRPSRRLLQRWADTAV